MKKPMKRFLLLMTGVAMLGLVSSCKEEGPQKDDVVKFHATINSQPALPKSSSTAQGTGVFEYNKASMELKYNISYQNVTPVNITINAANPSWQIGDVVYPLATNPTGAQISGTIPNVKVGDQTQLLIGAMYVNITSKTYPYGEIRGQIVIDEVEY
ncbi:CHRD domain-containing protein [Dyadobacter sp. CY356]|uniref:CHRD domain-containing protein n=1 Tax=Dyadobacter sp. CY356 TaxID=2906442 RepID=UPI001F316470|nr:CHRD domain-containing protein [Dyadobacter sp. CY356]MCF0055392.1 CHRD domain-containing protein [Dyadobacter sp. CY356]